MNKLLQYNSRRLQYLLINVLRKLQRNIFNPSLRVLTFGTDSLQNISLKSDRKETVQKRLKTTVKSFRLFEEEDQRSLQVQAK